MFQNYGSLINRQHPIGPDVRLTDLVKTDIPFCADEDDPKRLLRRKAAIAARNLFQAADEQGIGLRGISGFRSYKRQAALYQESIALHGIAHTEKYLAPPGCSEHQSGLALDVSSASVNYELVTTFSHTLEGRWLAKNAPLYGFILRYPKSKEAITGYAYEPWHIRYVTKPLALYLLLTGQTLEEFHSQKA